MDENKNFDDEAFEVSDADAEAEDAAAGDSEPSDGESLGSSDDDPESFESSSSSSFELSDPSPPPPPRRRQLKRQRGNSVAFEEKLNDDARLAQLRANIRSLTPAYGHKPDKTLRQLLDLERKGLGQDIIDQMQPVVHALRQSGLLTETRHERTLNTIQSLLEELEH